MMSYGQGPQEPKYKVRHPAGEEEEHGEEEDLIHPGYPAVGWGVGFGGWGHCLLNCKQNSKVASQEHQQR